MLGNLVFLPCFSWGSLLRSSSSVGFMASFSVLSFQLQLCMVTSLFSERHSSYSDEDKSARPTVLRLTWALHNCLAMGCLEHGQNDAWWG